MSISYEKVEGGELFKWDEEGKHLEGVLINYEARPDTGKGPGRLYEVKTAKGTISFFAPVILHKKLKDLPRPSIVDITLSEISKTKIGNTLKLFEVKTAPATDENLKLIGIEIKKTVSGEDDLENF